MRSFFTRRSLATGLATAFAVAGLAACSTDSLLKVEDPDVISPEATQSPAGAEGLRVGAWDNIRTSMQIGDAGGAGIFLVGGLLADEWKSGDTFFQSDEIDRRRTRNDNSTAELTYRRLHNGRTSAMQAIRALQKWSPTATSSIGQMYMAKGLVELMLADSYCNGLTLSDGSQATGPGDIKFGAPMTGAQVYQVALVSLDSAITVAGAGSNVGRAAAILKARALLALGPARYTEARAAVAGIPDAFAYRYTFQNISGDNGIWSLNLSQQRYVVGDTAGSRAGDRNALPFASARDPRVPAGYAMSGTRTLTAFDAGTPLSIQQIWTSRDSSLVIANGLDARMVEAEVMLKSGDVAGYYALINRLRAAVINPANNAASPLPALADAGSDRARVQQFFREKAFFQYGRGFRLGDLRRMIRDYGFQENEVFPVGNHHKGSTYGTDVNLPIPQAEQNNPNYPQPTDGASFNGCIDRKA